MNIRIVDFRPPKIAQLFIIIAALLHWFTPLSQFYLYSNQIIAVIVGAGGLGIMMWGWWLFRKFDTNICPTAKTSRLVTSGIYRLTRNPMYLGVICMLLAVAVFFGTLPFYLVTVVYFIIINNVFCSYEESKLLKSFGNSYLTYSNNVRRWF